jgi:hypothetical protein
MYFVGKQKGFILTSTNQDFLRDHFGDDIATSYGKAITLHAVRKTVAGRGVDTILIGLPAHIILEGEAETPASKTNQIQTSIPRLIRMGDVLFLQINRA